MRQSAPNKSRYSWQSAKRRSHIPLLVTQQGDGFFVSARRRQPFTSARLTNRPPRRYLLGVLWRGVLYFSQQHLPLPLCLLFTPIACVASLANCIMLVFLIVCTVWFNTCGLIPVEAQTIKLTKGFLCHKTYLQEQSSRSGGWAYRNPIQSEAIKP